MKKRKNQSLFSLMSLYLSYIFQKTTVIIFSASLVLMAFILFLLSNPWMDKDAYLASPDSFHLAYMTQAICILQIFNGILVTTVIISLILQSVSFDSLFISYTKRTTLCTAKVISAGILFLSLSLFEYIILYAYPVFLYKEYILDIKSLFTILVLFGIMMAECGLSMVLTTLIPSIFTPMVVLFIGIVKILISSSFSKVKEVLEGFWPLAYVEDGIVLSNSLYIAPILIVVLVFLYYALYCVKDLRQA